MEDNKEVFHVLTQLREAIARIEVNLAEHMRRTAIQEGKMESVEKHVHMVQGVIKFIGLIAVISTVVSTAYVIFK